ncbi:hypothetical protein MM560_G194n3 [Manis javanica]|nr:hypothetical protein MM560_G194n3 [Manis javanica]
MPRMKRKKNQPELSQENRKRHRSTLGVHTLEPVQVLHALGKKADKETGFSSSQALGNSRNPKDPQPPPATKPWLNTPHEGKGLGKTHASAQKPDGCVQRECPSPSQDERPPPGKVKLVPLPFLTEDRPQARRVPRRPQSLASRRPALASSTRPGSTDAAQPTAVGSSRQASASLTVEDGRRCVYVDQEKCQESLMMADIMSHDHQVLLGGQPAFQSTAPRASWWTRSNFGTGLNVNLTGPVILHQPWCMQPALNITNNLSSQEKSPWKNPFLLGASDGSV